MNWSVARLPAALIGRNTCSVAQLGKQCAQQTASPSYLFTPLASHVRGPQREAFSTQSVDDCVISVENMNTCSSARAGRKLDYFSDGCVALQFDRRWHSSNFQLEVVDVSIVCPARVKYFSGNYKCEKLASNSEDHC